MIASISGDAFLSDRVLWRDLHLKIDRGWTVLLGPSGSGKSTLLRLLAGLPTAARLNGKRHAPEIIGWMAQNDLLQERMSPLENIMLTDRLRGRKPAPKRARQLLCDVGLDEQEVQRVASLSGGQRQRLALARTLYCEAELILLDEPFSALDPAARAQMQELAQRLLAERAVMMVTHDPMEALRLGQRILVLTGQSWVELGEPASSTPAARLQALNKQLLHV